MKCDSLVNHISRHLAIAAFEGSTMRSKTRKTPPRDQGELLPAQKELRSELAKTSTARSSSWQYIYFFLFSSKAMKHNGRAHGTPPLPIMQRNEHRANAAADGCFWASACRATPYKPIAPSQIGYFRSLARTTSIWCISRSIMRIEGCIRSGQGCSLGQDACRLKDLQFSSQYKHGSGRLNSALPPEERELSCLPLRANEHMVVLLSERWRI